jgi:hypothetical protein
MPTINEDFRKRQRSTFKIDCPVRIKARERATGLSSLCHPESKEGHNHPPGEPTAYPEHRRLNKQQISIVSAHHAAGIPASRTIIVLREQFESLNINHRDIYNITAQIARAKRIGTSPPEALIAHLTAEREAGMGVF